MSQDSWKKDLEEILSPILESGFDLEDPEPEYIHEFKEDTLAIEAGFDKDHNLGIAKKAGDRGLEPKKKQRRGKFKGDSKKSGTQTKK
ncbi:MAG: hypothetical protein JHC26_01650 [Thermofilum sp.]|jgi:hypothetical protein|uniref:hypothetical protein n=1 Tax=Thermofilum sp. TaxID=1961369 RepID=UPI002583C2A3|nr:hypothetical protein [Thermofilum sp.]MCI4407766.1 hypothetical protein [Thermofilum sp.]